MKTTYSIRINETILMRGLSPNDARKAVDSHIAKGHRACAIIENPKPFDPEFQHCARSF